MVKKIRVIHFTIANVGGGTTKAVLRLWKYIDRERFHFDFVTMSDKLDFAAELEAEGCKVYYLSTYAEDNPELFNKEVREILSNGYDVIHLQTSHWRGFAIEKIAKEIGIPKVILYSNMTNVPDKEGKSREMERRRHFQQRELLTEDMATDFVACSEAAAEWLYGDRIPKEKIKIVPYAIELEDYKYNENARKKYREVLGIKNEFVIGHVGRFEYQKNHEFLLDVFQDIARIDNQVKLLLVGVGELQETVKRRVKELGIESKVIFTGKRNDVAGLMQAMDVFAFPSRHEGFGIVLIEAQAAGLKCITSKGIPSEARITDNIEFLELNKKIWVDSILKYKDGYVRKDMSEIMEAKGWGMKAHAAIFEQIYLN